MEASICILGTLCTMCPSVLLWFLGSSQKASSRPSLLSTKTRTVPVLAQAGDITQAEKLLITRGKGL